VPLANVGPCKWLTRKGLTTNLLNLGYHWALDRNLIAPGPDLRWHVSKVLDPRLRDNAALLDLDGTDILLPQNARYRPREDALQYRLEHLRER